MSPGGGVRLLIGRFRGRLRRYAVADTVEYEADAVPDQLPNTRGYGGERLGDQVPVPMWGGVCYPSVFRRERLSHHLGRAHFFFFFFFISLIADGPHHHHPACGHKGSSHLSPIHALQFFYRDASSALLQLVNQWLKFTDSRSHAFRYERKNTNPTLVRIELTTSVLADVQLTY